MIKTIFFDLDGTLTPMNGDDFVNSYFKQLTTTFVKFGFEPKTLIKLVWAGTEQMMKNDGSKTNFDVFWETVSMLLGKDMKTEIGEFDEFYLNEFDNVKEIMPENYSLRGLFDRLKAKGYRLILATNPFFPYNAAVTRLSWLGLNVDDFEYISTMENSCFTKPNLKYYEEILNLIGEKAENCLMVGNNPVEDMCASELGFKVFLMPEYIENKTNVDCSQYPQGDFNDFEKFLKED